MKTIFISLIFFMALIFLCNCDKNDQNPKSFNQNQTPSNQNSHETDQSSNGMSINIPDKNFLNALLENNTDKNGDGIISTEEAKSATTLDASNRDITDLTGIEAFINLDVLICSNNMLTNLNVANNTALITLKCSSTN